MIFDKIKFPLICEYDIPNCCNRQLNESHIKNHVISLTYNNNSVKTKKGCPANTVEGCSTVIGWKLTRYWELD